MQDPHTTLQTEKTLTTTIFITKVAAMATVQKKSEFYQKIDIDKLYRIYISNMIIPVKCLPAERCLLTSTVIIVRKCVKRKVNKAQL